MSLITNKTTLFFVKLFASKNRHTEELRLNPQIGESMHMDSYFVKYTCCIVITACRD